MRHLDLFSGIGGFALGLKWAGNYETIGFCEIDKAAQKVLKKHWPNVPIYDDIKTLKGGNFGTVDIITGGFPCQDISIAGKGAGLAGERSGLWFEYLRIIKETKPKWVIAENVSALRSRGLDQVLWSLSEIGYDAEWHCIPAAAIGAPHRRDRIWIVAYPHGSLETYGGQCQVPSQEGNRGGVGPSGSLSDARQGCVRGSGEGSEDDVAYSNSIGLHTAKNKCVLESQGQGQLCLEQSRNHWSRWWKTEPGVGRVAHGISGRVDRLKQLGNAIVPQIAQILGIAILEREYD